MSGAFSFAGRRVLVVEDEYLIADDLRRALEAEGVCVVGPVPSVDAAMDVLDAHTPIDVAILDVNLGGEWALPVADRLDARGVPFVFATGYDAWAMPKHYARHARCEKPVSLPQLRTVFARRH